MVAGPMSVVVCIPAPSGVGVAPCNDAGAVMEPSVVTGYVLTPSEYATFGLAVQPWDPNEAAMVFAQGASLVIVALLLGYAVGGVVSLIRSAR